MVKGSVTHLFGRFRLRKPLIIALFLIALFLIPEIPFSPPAHATNTPPPGYQAQGPFKISTESQANTFQGSIERQEVYAVGRYWVVFFNSTNGGDCVVTSSGYGWNTTWSVPSDTGFVCSTPGISVDTSTFGNGTTFLFIAHTYVLTVNKPLALSWASITSTGTIGTWKTSNIGPAKSYMSYNYVSLAIRQGVSNPDMAAFLTYDWVNGTGGSKISNEYLVTALPAGNYPLAGNFTLHTSTNNCGWDSDVMEMGGGDNGGSTMYVAYSQAPTSIPANGPCLNGMFGRRVNYGGVILGAEENLQSVTQPSNAQWIFSVGYPNLVAIIVNGTLPLNTQFYFYITRTDNGAGGLAGSWSTPFLIAPLTATTASVYPEMDPVTQLIYIWIQDTNAGGPSTPGIFVIYGTGTKWTTSKMIFPMGGPTAGGYIQVNERNNAPRYAATPEQIWTVWTFGANNCSPLCENDFGVINPLPNTETHQALFQDDFLYTNQYLSSSWTMDSYAVSPLGMYTSAGYLVLTAQAASGSETAHVQNPIFQPSLYTNGTAVKRKMTVAAVPFAKTESPSTAALKVGITRVVTTGAFPGTTPYGVPNTDINGNCAQSANAVDNIGIEYILMDTTGLVTAVICGGNGGRLTTNLESGLTPSLYTVFTIETYAVFCSTCTDNEATGAWVYFRVYQEDFTGRIIQSTDKNTNFTALVSPLYGNAFAFVAQQNSNAAATKQVSRVDFVQVQNFGSPVCLVCQIPRIPASPSLLTGFPGILSFAANFLGGGDLAIGGFVMFFITMFGIGVMGMIAAKNVVLTAGLSIIDLGIFVYAALVPTWFLVGVVILSAFMVLGVYQKLTGSGSFGGGGGD